VRRCAFAWALCLASSPAWSQDLPVFSSSIEVVRVDVSVTRDGRPGEGLKAADFEVRDDGVLQAVEIVGGVDKPIDAVLALDVSSSVAGQRLQQLKTAAHALVDVLRPEDAVTLLTFSDRIQLRVSPADSRERAHEIIDRTEAQLTTALYDATYAALTTTDPARGRPLVLIFSDGQDVGSWLKPEQVLRVAEASELVVHAVLSRREGTEVVFLRDLVASTGGHEWRADFDELKDVMLRALDEFRSRYTLQYERRRGTGDGWHKLQVRVNAPGAEVRARRGYWQRTLPPAAR
jgi:VWFA-related protein